MPAPQIGVILAPPPPRRVPSGLAGVAFGTEGLEIGEGVRTAGGERHDVVDLARNRTALRTATAIPPQSSRAQARPWAP